MTLIVNFITMFAFYCVGFAAGYLSQKEKIHDVINETKEHIKRINSPVGVVNRLSASELLKRTDPHERKLEEEKQAMRETLGNIKELK